MSTVLVAATYSLPTDLGTGPFSSCSGGGPIYSCNSDIVIPDNDIVNLTADVTLDINGNLTLGQNVDINDSGFNSSLLVDGNVTADNGASVEAAITATGNFITANNTSFTGDIDIDGNFTSGNNSSFNGDINADGNVNIGNNNVVNGDVTAGGNLDVGNNGVVNGTCTPSHPNCTGGGPPGGQVCETFRDEFSSVNYANQDGTRNWAGNWSEDGDDGSPSSGSISISSNSLRFRGSGTAANALGGPFIQRQADLSSFTSATLTFDYRETGNWEASDEFRIYVSGDGGSNWVLLQTFANDQGGGFQPFSADISAFIASNTRVAFVELANANNEIFYVDNIQIEACTAAVDHFSISHDGSAVNCQPEPITISAHTSATAPHVVETGYTGTITLSVDTAHGDWSYVSGGSAANLTNLGNGDATYIFDGSESGSVVLALSNTFAETIDINVTDGSASETSGSADATDDPPLTYAPSGFSFVGDGMASAIGTQIAGKASNLGYGSQLLEIEAINTNTVTGACEAALAGSVSVEIAFECQNPGVCQRPLYVGSVAPSTQVGGTNAGDALSYTTLTLDFGDSSDTTASFVLNYPDAGQIQLHARYLLAPSGEDLLGSSNLFVVRPFGFDVSVTHPTPPHAIDTNGNILTSAGSPFTVNASAALWNAADDNSGGSDGRPDNHDDTDPANNDSLATNSVILGGNTYTGTPNFGQASSEIELTAQLFAPAAGNDPGLAAGTLITAFSGGAGSNNAVTYDEVGIIEIAAAISGGNYLGIGAAETALMVSRSGHVGRFTPASLSITSTTDGQFAHANPNGAVPFTYIGQAFGYDAAQLPSFVVSALNVGGTVTQNYTGAWAKLSTAGITLTSPISDQTQFGSDGLTLMVLTYSQNLGFSSNDLANGTFRIDFGVDDSFTYDKDGNSQVAAFAQDIDLVITEVRDSDNIATTAGATLQPAPPATTMPGTQVRFGRLRMENAYGSELADLPMNLFFEYFDEAGSVEFWVRLDDVDSTLSVALPDEIDEQPPNTNATAINPVIPGQYTLNLSAPGAGNTGDYLITTLVDISGESWLQWDWDSDGLFDNNPSAIASFGIFGGSPVQIYLQQIFQ